MTHSRIAKQTGPSFHVVAGSRRRAAALFALTAIALMSAVVALFVGAGRATAGAPVGVGALPPTMEGKGYGSAAYRQPNSPSDDPSADLMVSKTAPSSADAGTNITYTITVSNNGPDDALNATWSDTLPAGLTFVSLTQDSGPAFTCSSPDPGTNGAINCDIATLPAGASAEFTLIAHIPGNAAPGTSYTNIVTVSSNTFDPNDENNSGSAVTYVPTPYADLSVIKTGPSSTPPDTDIAYTITVTNAGPDDASNATWTDTLPGTSTFVSLSQNNGPTFSCNTPAPGAGGTITCSISDLPAGSGAEFTLVVHIPSDTTSGTEFMNTASVSSDTPDPNDENNSSSALTTVGSADVSVVKSGPATATAGENITYTITIANDGPDPAVEVTLSDTLASGLTFVSLTQNNGPAFNCNPPPVGSSGLIMCSKDALSAGASAQFTLVARASSSLNNGANVTNTAAASSSVADTDTTDNSSSVTTTFSASADLSVNKTAPVTVTAGSNVTYSITLTNTGPSDAQSVTLTDNLAMSTTFISLAQTSGPALTCNTSGGNNVTCSRASLPADSTATLDLTVRPDAGLHNGDVVTNTATINSTTNDPSVGDHTSVVSSTVASVADLGISKTHTGTVELGRTVTYVITVTNSGPSVAYGAVVTDTFQTGLTKITYSCAVKSGARSHCYVANSAGHINATVDVDVQGSVVFTATALVSDPSSASLTNTAYVSLPAANGTDPDSSDNSSTDVADIAPTATQTSTPTSTSTSTVTSTATRTSTSTSTAVPNATATACAIKFADVPPVGEGSTFYGFVRCLACRHIISGYPCGGPHEPCNQDNDPYYRPGANVTRGQLSKIIANAAGLSDTPAEGQQQFADVHPGDPFYLYVERLAQTGAIAGYPCGGPGVTEPCDSKGRPYFRPNNPATRGQISKIVSIAAGFEEDVPEEQQTFTDVPTDSPFWVYIERLAGRGVISGYGEESRCPETGAPCFRYNDQTTRGQMAKIAANTFFPNCDTPARQ